MGNYPLLKCCTAATVAKHFYISIGNKISDFWTEKSGIRIGICFWANNILKADG